MEKVWLASYPDGVPEIIPDPPFNSLTEMMKASMIQFSSRKAYTNMGSSMTFGELDTLSDQFACYLLLSLGLKKGDRVAIMLPNINQYPVALCGILKAGLVVVNVNPLYTPRELKHQLSDSKAKAILILENFANVLSEIIDDTSLGYRKLQEVKKWKKKDPLIFSRGYLTKKRLFNKKQIETLDKKINNNVDKDFKFLNKLKKPKFKDISRLVYKR